MSVAKYKVGKPNRRSAVLTDGIVVVTDSGNPAISAVRAFVAGDATPSVALGNTFYTANTVATTITDFDNTKGDGHCIRIYVADAFTTIEHDATKIDCGGVDISPTTGDWLQFCSYGGVWRGGILYLA